MEENNKQKIFVWDAPLRIFHWVFTISFFTLLITGLMMASPSVTHYGEPWNQFRMATTTNIHLIAANIFTLSFLFRILWFFTGNEYSRWRRIALIKSAHWKEILYMIKEYSSFRHTNEEPFYAGHNALAAAVYRIIYLLSLFMIVTGFALRAGIMSDGIIAALFGWINPLLGAEGVTRFWHHFISWIITALATFHILWSFSYTLLVDRSTIGSIFTGFKKRSPGWKIWKPWES